MAAAMKMPKRRSKQGAPKETDEEFGGSRRDCSLHFRVPRLVADAIEKAAGAERRTLSAWVAICVEDRLRTEGYLS